MRRGSVKIIPIIIIVILFLSLIVAFTKTINKPLSINSDIVINVNKGDSFYSIINSLSKEDKIKGIPFIKLYVKVLGKNIEVKQGEYILEKDMSLKELIETLTSESSLNIINFTVPEGYTIDDIAEKLETEGVCSKEDFILAINEYNLPKYVKVNHEKKYNLEGYLFPDTYLIKVGETPKEIIEKMVLRFEEVLKIAMTETNTNIKEDDIETVITIASMIEKEGRVNEERPLISSVIVNRLNNGMMLQIDATVIYALGEHVNTVLNKHLEIDSPYNTYKNYGLPIGPISNPGLESIKAAIKPAETDYLFYVLQDEKTHYFTNSDVDFMNKLEELGY
ncbi:endolytic transglycosylase MltG [Clostridium sp. Sa3CUN1]|uniref:Endolytic murein transglycosylase n=1 Tax=Clostridium gallinarum TaxID=2762246 RepID=A0ABR8Q168_9CLOT|nr:endolytic transglycosylase MltG [Clostridium gallinarum]MBD7914152.1 endolytic transglycosylase MltG [Clostridium gallinarum]